MNRRRLLATLGIGLGGAAGCLSDAPAESKDTPTDTESNPTDTTPTESPTDSTPTGSPDDTGETVPDIVASKAVTYESFGSGGVLAADGRQYVVAAIETDGRYPNDEYGFEANGQTWESGLPTTAGGNTRSVAGIEWPLVGFELPSPLSVSSPRIRSADGDGEWLLGDTQVETLSAPAPRYELDELSVPDSITQGTALSVTLSATNVSETDGRFLAAVYWPTDRIADDDESHVVDRTVAAGETVTASVDIRTDYTRSEDGPVTLSVRGHVTEERTVQVRTTDTS